MTEPVCLPPRMWLTWTVYKRLHKDNEPFTHPARRVVCREANISEAQLDRFLRGYVEFGLLRRMGRTVFGEAFLLADPLPAVARNKWSKKSSHTYYGKLHEAPPEKVTIKGPVLPDSGFIPRPSMAKLMAGK
jgi:hypothetical protein